MDTQEQNTQRDTSADSSAQAPDTITPPAGTIIDSITNTPLYELITKALEDNAAWKEHIRVSLITIQELYSAHYNLIQFYKANLNALETSNSTLQEKREEILKLYETFKSDSDTLQAYIQAQTKELGRLNEQMLANAQTTLNNLNLCNEVLAQVKKENADFNVFKLQVQDTLDKLNLLINEREALENLSTKLQALMKEYEDLRNTSLEELQARKETLLNDLEAKNQEFLSAQEAKNQELLGELTEHKATLATELDAFVTRVNELISELEQSFLTKQELINTTIEDLKAKHQLFGEKYDEVQNSFNDILTKIAEAKEQITTLKLNALSEIDTRKDEHITTLEQKKNEHSDTLANLTDEHSATLTQLKDDYKLELDSIGAAQIADLTQIVNAIKAKQELYGNNFVRESFSANGIFTKNADALFYYVFLQGGDGANNSATQGGVTSFGSLLSALGGAGNTNGAGLKGQINAGFVEITDEQTPVIVGSGGICIVSYATKV